MVRLVPGKRSEFGRHRYRLDDKRYRYDKNRVLVDSSVYVFMWYVLYFSEKNVFAGGRGSSFSGAQNKLGNNISAPRHTPITT